MRKVRLPDDQFLSVLRAAICKKVAEDGTTKPPIEIQQKTKEVLESKNKSEC